MKKIILITMLAVFAVSCGNNTQKNNSQTTADTIDNSVVYVYYFHGKARCKTCIAIEKVAVQTVADNFSNNPKVQYKEVDFSQKENDAIAEKYEISFSSLIVAKGDDFSDLTDDAFAMALSNPEKLTDLIKEEVNKRIN